MCIRMVRRLHHAVNTTADPHITTIPSTQENRLGVIFVSLFYQNKKKLSNNKCPRIFPVVHVSSGDEVEMGLFLVTLLTVILFPRIKRRGSLEIRAQEI